MHDYAELFSFTSIPEELSRGLPIAARQKCTSEVHVGSS